MANTKKRNIIKNALGKVENILAAPAIKYQNLKGNMERKKMVDKAAERESEKIVDKLSKDNNKFVEITKLPGGTIPPSYSKRDETIKQVANQVKKVRRSQYKKKGLIN